MTVNHRVRPAGPLVISACALALACGPVSPPVAPPSAPTGFGGAGGQAASEGQCVVPKGDTEPFVVEWVTSRPAGVQFTRSEITVSQYQACVNAGKCSKPNDKSDHKNCNWGYGDRGSHPINCIDWNQAKAVCEWLGGRLPTEDEWFKEASAGGTRDFPWGNQQVTCDYAVWIQGGSGCGRDSTWPVCSKRKGDSVSGLCDMSGNVWEWTSTPEGSACVLRGGSWANLNPELLRASNRYWVEPTNWVINFGVRCSRDD